MQQEAMFVRVVELICAIRAMQVCEAAMEELEEEQALLQALSEEEREQGDSLGNGEDATPDGSPPERTSTLAPRVSPPKLR